MKSLEVTYYNPSVGGWTVEHGYQNVENHVNTAIDKYGCDLFTVAFGMNNAGLSAGKFVQYTEGIIKRVQTHAPNTGIVMVSTMVPNPEATNGWHGNQYQFEAEIISIIRMISWLEYMHRSCSKPFSDTTANNEKGRVVIMRRHTFALEVKPGRMAEFRSGLGQVWAELTTFLDSHGMVNFSVWNVERIVFGYYETGDDFLFDAKDKVKVAEWEMKYGDSYTWISVPFEDMRMMYQDFGIVRKSKELIRHLVFITKLKDGMEEDYKARHDALIEARGDKVTEGPDSNFSIWYAGGYIFGYNEIDTTMEHEMTEEERESTIRWENRMLEIMSWMTNDVDWITGECHASIQRLGWHK